MMPTVSEEQRRMDPRIWVAQLLLLVSILSYIALGFANRASTDDYCFASRAVEHGFWQSQAWWWNNWQGTYSSTFVQSVIGALAAWQFSPFLLIFFWNLTAFWAVREWMLLLGMRPGLLAPLVSMGLLFAALSGTANVFQSVFWVSGAVTYTSPLILLCASMAVLARALRRTHDSLLSYTALIAGLAIGSAGFSPIYAVVQVAVFVLIFGALQLFAPPALRKRGQILAGTAFIFALLGLLLMYTAPGTSIRSSRMDLDSSWISILLRAVLNTLLYFTYALTVSSPWAILFAFALGGWIGLRYVPLDAVQRRLAQQRSFRRIAWITAFIYALLFTAFFVPSFAAGGPPPLRAGIIIQSLTVLMVFGWGLSMGMGLQQAAPFPAVARMTGAVALLLVFVLGPLGTTLDLAGRMGDFYTFAREWDERDAYLRSLPDGAEATIQSFSFDLADVYLVERLEPDPGLRACLATYHGLAQIQVVDR